MNKLQIVEMLRLHHGDITSRQAEIYLKLAANRMAEETNLIKVTTVASSVAGQRWYSLPNDTIKVYKVWFNDVLIPRLIGDVLIDDDEFTDDEDTSDTALSAPTSVASNKRFWMFSDFELSDTGGSETSAATDEAGSINTGHYIRHLGIVEQVINAVTRDGRTSNYQSCSVTGTSNVRILRTRYPRDFNQATPGSQNSLRDATNEDTNTPLRDIPDAYHDLLLTGAIAIGYKYPPKISLDLYNAFQIEFEKGLKRLKRFERNKHATGFIRPQDF